jgi:TetR/AcrR family tetracycline transcriptional repressor
MPDRKPLSRQIVLENALALADAEGLDALSLRRLARELGVTPMALYRYVESKDDLLDGIGDLVLGLLDLGDPAGQDWKQRLRRAARSYRRLLVAHPSAVEIVSSRPLFTPNALGVTENLLGLLRGAGFSVEEALRLYQQIARFVVGLVFLETRTPWGGRSDDERAELRRRARIQLEALSPAAYPRLVEATEAIVSPPDFDCSFELGIDLLLAGLEALLARRS